MPEHGAGAGQTHTATGLPASRRALEVFRRLEEGLERLDLERAAPLILGLATIASGLLMYHLTLGSSFWGEDWASIVSRRANNVHPFLSPYDGPLSVLPIVIFRVMFAAFGIDSYAPYRVMVI